MALYSADCVENNPFNLIGSVGAVTRKNEGTSESWISAFASDARRNNSLIFSGQFSPNRVA
jgi:hypothetical protein